MAALNKVIIDSLNHKKVSMIVNLGEYTYDLAKNLKYKTLDPNDSDHHYKIVKRNKLSTLMANRRRGGDTLRHQSPCHITNNYYYILNDRSKSIGDIWYGHFNRDPTLREIRNGLYWAAGQEILTNCGDLD